MATAVEKIRQIVQLKQVMKRWRVLSLRGGGEGGGRRSSPSESDSGSNRRVRAGFVAVYPGEAAVRDPDSVPKLAGFASLLDRAEEYGFQPAGGLALPCVPAFFQWVVDAFDRDEDRFKGLGLDPFLRLFADCASSSYKKCSSNSGFAPFVSKTWFGILKSSASVEGENLEEEIEEDGNDASLESNFVTRQLFSPASPVVPKWPQPPAVAASSSSSRQH